MIMPASLRSIPPLVPLPDSTVETTANDKYDIFSTLFSPATPHASPTLNPVPDERQAPVPRRSHARTFSSTSCDFGSFVSVPAAEHPLQPSAASSGTAQPLTPLSSDFFDKFTEDARIATEKNKQGYLAELLEHQDDPLYFLNGGVSSSGGETPMRATTPRPKSPSSESTSPPDSLPPSTHDEPAKNLPPAEINTSSIPVSPQRSPLLRSPTLPTFPIRPTPPVISRTQSQSTFSTSAFSSRLMSNLLPSRSTVGHTSASPSPPPVFMRHPTLPPGIGRAGPGITHGSPFAAHPYVPPSGAPGFAGDHMWDKGFEFDEVTVEKKSVKLVGRRESTNPVLSSELADQIRPYLPALARLPRSWTLLYSLDQHGISLQTLYMRCENHLGGALVVVRDSGDSVFGAWMSEGVHPSKGSYYGSGESFLWKSSDKLKVYKWTGKNDYVALCEPKYLSFGGGDGHYGLYLDDTLFDGSSARCPTFENDPLCSPGPRKGRTVTFECVGLEVWGVGPA
ncbi:hypothetical protein EW146_g3712 [Bondarzewia mesenterica]|uniref:Oxidation resistance protein 1 n=1 Tax=Bondarzewia mesenterica TaxID=1095465 RepID=A0A4S4LY68_9AGAM|nr:hypothetical protein EW146_g3712 [Bondarzewia mesenterica]